jgi:hypothetical protein
VRLRLGQADQGIDPRRTSRAAGVEPGEVPLTLDRARRVLSGLYVVTNLR